MCIGAVTDDGSRMVGIYEEEGFTFTHMQFIAEWPDGLHPITRTRQFPTFPITVTPATKTMSVDCKASPVSRIRNWSKSGPVFLFARMLE